MDPYRHFNVEFKSASVNLGMLGLLCADGFMSWSCRLSVLTVTVLIWNSSHTFPVRTDRRWRCRALVFLGHKKFQFIICAAVRKRREGKWLKALFIFRRVVVVVVFKWFRFILGLVYSSFMSAWEVPVLGSWSLFLGSGSSFGFWFFLLL